MPTALTAEDTWIYADTVKACYEGVDQAGGLPGGCIGDAAELCMESEAGGYSTSGMVLCLAGEHDSWDVFLNAEYQSARDAAARRDEYYSTTDPNFAGSAESLIAAQRAWIVFRDANCTMKYDAWGNGSIRRVIGVDCQMQMTAERAIELRQYRQQN